MDYAIIWSSIVDTLTPECSPDIVDNTFTSDEVFNRISTQTSNGLYYTYLRDIHSNL